MSKFMTDRITVSFAYLNRPDDKFGADTANFNVTVPLTDSLSKQIKEAVDRLGAKKVNGVYEKDGEKFIKFKNRLLVRDGAESFPCVDSQAKATKVTAAGGDVVKLMLKPSLIKRDSSLSVYLDGVQILEKNSTFGQPGAGFAAEEGGFVAGDDDVTPNDDPTEFTSTDEAPATAGNGDDDLPF